MRVLLLAALATTAFGQGADATLFSMPKSLKTSPLQGIEMSLPIWGPSAHSFYCVEHLSACQAPDQWARTQPPAYP
jgi:hypothetical protein